MSLVLEAQVGDIIDVGPTWIMVCVIDDRHTVTVRTGDGREEKITSREFRPIFADVEIRLGPARSARRPKLLFRAPRSIRIRRRRTGTRPACGPRGATKPIRLLTTHKAVSLA